MNQYLPTILEFLVMAVIWLLSIGLTLPLRRQRRDGSSGGKPRGFGSLIRYVLQPVLVVLLTRLVKIAAAAVPRYVTWAEQHPTHLLAWDVFWIGVVVILLVEGLTHVFYARRGKDYPIPDLLLDILRLLLIMGWAFGVLKLQLGIDIAPLLASTALLTAVVGFALQGVLGNLLAGMSMHISRSVFPGDWISVGDVEGKVMQTNWRETRIRTMSGHVMVVPNSTVAGSVVHNMVRPTAVRRHAIDVGASYSDEPDQVIAALLEAAAEVPDVMRSPAPDAYVTAFLDFGVNYRLRFWTRDYHRRLQIDGDVNRMIWYKFKRRGIEIPFPMSDQLLNDFMAVVYNQRKLDPTDKELARITADLLASDLVAKLVVDDEGRPMLTDEDLQAVAPTVRRVPFTKGEHLFQQNDEGHSCYILVSGSLKGQVKDDRGKPVVDFTVTPGSVVGEMSLMLDVPRTADVVAAESSVLLELGHDAFCALLSLRDEVPEAFARLAAERAEANRAALEAWAASQQDNEPVELSHDGLLRRFMRLVRR